MSDCGDGASIVLKHTTAIAPVKSGHMHVCRPGQSNLVYRVMMPAPLATLLAGSEIIAEAYGVSYAFNVALTEVRLPPVQGADRENSKFWATLDLTSDYVLQEVNLVQPISVALADAGFTLRPRVERFTGVRPP
jgi:hypothetical protein